MTGRIFAITGGFGVLGSAVAAAALASGARVALIDAAPAREGAPEGALALGGVDLTSPAAAVEAFREITDRFGGLDVLVNVAGGFVWQTLADGDPEQWARLYALNTLTNATASRAALPHLLASKAGRIVSVGANGATKAAAGMHRLTESLAEEMKGKITVNAVLPSIIDTPTNRADMPDADFGAWVTADEVAQAILWLASEQASGVTGALLPVTGRV